MPYHPVTGKIIETKIKFDMFELGCATGFFNGEGCIFISYGERPRIRSQIGQKDKKELIKFNKTFFNFGTPIYQLKNGMHLIYFSGFEKVQFIIACMWRGLSDQKKEQYKRIIVPYLIGQSKMDKRAFNGRKKW